MRVGDTRERVGWWAARARVQKLSASPRNEAADLHVAERVVVWPHYRGPELVWFFHHGGIGHIEPLAIETHAIMHAVGVALRIPVDVLDLAAVDERAAEPLPARQLVEPLVQRRVLRRVAAVQIARGGRPNQRANKQYGTEQMAHYYSSALNCALK